MSKPYAKIVVRRNRYVRSFWQVCLLSDLPSLAHVLPRRDEGDARRTAKQWSRRLGNIPVEVEE